jgi:hypothetical protein
MVARWVTIGIVVIMAATLGGCDALQRQNLWRTKTDHIRIFVTPIRCSIFSESTVGKSPIFGMGDLTFYEMLESQWWINNDACRGAIVCPPSSWAMPSDRYARRITFINQQGAVQNSKAWVVDQTNAMPLSVDVSAKHNIPYTAFPPDLKNPAFTCVSVVTIPWQRDRNRPFWVADTTLQMDPTELLRNNAFTGVILSGFAVLFTFGTLFAGAGFDRGGARWRGVFLSLTIAAVGFIILVVIRENGLVEPYDRLLRIQDYYRFFSSLPQTAGGYLLPLHTKTMASLFWGPPLTTELDQSVEKFEFVALCLLLLWLLFFWKRALMGFYYLLVPHRAETFVLPALRTDDRKVWRMHSPQAMNRLHSRRLRTNPEAKRRKPAH